MSGFDIKQAVRVSGGVLTRFTHLSAATQTKMTCAVFIPNAASAADIASMASATVPYIVYLSGLTCTDENVCQKGSPFAHLAKHQIGFVAPDTSPRGHPAIPGESDGWDFGLGAGFYVDATTEPFKAHYNMYSYVVKELPTVLAEHFPALDAARVGIMGHSMGGHGALTIAMKNAASRASGTAADGQQKYLSVTAFAPICRPTQCPWGVKAFTGYLGEEGRDDAWHQYDACSLVRSLNGAGAGAQGPLFDDILIDVGTADVFLEAGQLQPEAFQEAASAAGQPATVRLQEGYDHSYFFCSSFMGDHVDHHAARLRK